MLYYLDIQTYNYSIMKLLLIQLFILRQTFANLINTGCVSYNCQRNCMSKDMSQTPGDNGFKFEIDFSSYKPEKTYKS